MYSLSVRSIRTFIRTCLRSLHRCHIPPLAPYLLIHVQRPRTTQRVHLTNTWFQDGSREGSVVRFWDLLEDADNLPDHSKNDVFENICRATGILFEAAAREQMIHLQTLGNAFEIFGVD